MRRDDTASHVTNSISDYVLELLPEEDRRQFLRHIAGCALCRRSVQQERKIGEALQSTLTIVGRPNPARLKQLMPSLPTSRPGTLTNLSWQKQLAVACLILLMILGSLTLEIGRRHNVWPGAAPTSRHTSVAITDTPTQTATSTVVSSFLLEPAPIPTPSVRHSLAVPRLATIPVPPTTTLH